MLHMRCAMPINCKCQLKLTEYCSTAISDIIQVNVWSCCCVPDIAAEFGDVRPLDKARMQRLTVNYVRMLDLVNFDHAFVSKLTSRGCITERQGGHLLTIGQPRERSEKLIDYLSRRSVASFEQFTKVLFEYGVSLMPLSRDAGETVLICNYMLSTLVT